MSITGDAEPTKAGVALVDVLTGLHATVGILAALRHREATGIGQHLEVTLLGALQSSLVNQASAFVGAGVVPGRLGNAHPSIAPYEVLAARDRPMVVAVGNDGQFARLAEVIGLPGIEADPQFAANSARVRNRLALRVLLEAQLGERDADAWQADLTAVGVPCGPINDVAQGFALAERLGLEPVVTLVDGPRRVRQVANPVRFSATPIAYRGAPPGIGEDRAEVLAMLGLPGAPA
jgi:crotonobetainyl-CoA:carnitine CoA-transferase CaiB-like acyl-CoA transferase